MLRSYCRLLRFGSLSFVQRVYVNGSEGLLTGLLPFAASTTTMPRDRGHFASETI